MPTQNTTCCGLKELFGISSIDTRAVVSPSAATPASILRECAVGWQNTVPTAAFILFTSVEANTRGEVRRYGATFRDFIVNNHLGTVTESPSLQNPNTLNMIKAWIWGLDRSNLMVWINAQRITPEEVTHHNAITAFNLESIRRAGLGLPYIPMADPLRAAENARIERLQGVPAQALPPVAQPQAAQNVPF